MADKEGAWLPIDTAPRDGTTFITARFVDGKEPDYEMGRYDPSTWTNYEPAGNGLFRQIQAISYEWRGFCNFHRMTHWAPLPKREE